MDNICGNALIIKEININYVRKILMEKGKSTTQQIAKETGLSIVTVGTILQQLAKETEISETELVSSNGGRPARAYQYNFDFSYALTLFPYETEGKLMLHTTLINLSGKHVSETASEVKAVDLKTFEMVINPILMHYPQIKSIGFGLPAFESKGKLLGSDYKDLIGVPFVEHFEQLYKLPVVMENDVNSAVVGFNKRENLPSEDTLIYLYYPDQYPPGSGIVINGKLFKGKDSFAGEVAAMPLGITWDKTLYQSFDAFCQAASKLIVAISSLLNPDHIVLNGNFLTGAHLETITKTSKEQLPQNVAPNILLSDNFIADYQKGLTTLTLKLLEPNIQLLVTL